MKSEVILLFAFLIYLGACSSHKPDGIEGPVCVANSEDVSLSCGNGNPYKKWKWTFGPEIDGWVCIPPDSVADLIKRAARSSR